jgi:cellulose synthase/poly-beta-1,6-N-acetylglucosamine synthase-like glycosyltransferase
LSDSPNSEAILPKNESFLPARSLASIFVSIFQIAQYTTTRMTIATNILIALLLVYLAWAVLYQLTYAIAGHFFKKEKGLAANTIRRFAVLIPAYKEDAVILGTAKASLKQNYPACNYDVFVIADQLKPETTGKLEQTGVHVVKVEFEKSTKSKSLNVALAQAGNLFDAVVVLDADNHMHPDFLLHINETMNKNHLAVQGCRAPKNKNNGLSVLDGVSEAVNNHLLCRGHRALGFSARLAGSGMAFEFGLFKQVMKTVDALGGFDKELELKLTQLGVKIAYAPAAIVLDEKVDNAGTFARQRGRWLAAQYRYGKRFALPALSALLLKGNVDFFNKTLQMALPPRLVLPFALAMGTLISLQVQPVFALFMGGLLLGNLTSFAIAIPREYWKPDFFKSLLHVPLALLSTLKALTLIPAAAKQFLHTAHGSVATASVALAPVEGSSGMTTA